MTQGIEVTSTRGVVAANPAPAAQIGAAILDAGGNAMDAAVAASLACCMLRPNQTGVGGYVCSAVIREGKTGKVWSVDANGLAPAAAHERMFDAQQRDPKSTGWLNELEYNCTVPNDTNMFGPLSITVPGMMAGMGIVHERWGALAWPQLIAPSLAMLEEGFPYGEEVAGAIGRLEPVLRRFPDSVAHLMPGGKVPNAQDIWHRPDMEKTLTRISQAGWRDFYEGQIGRQIADHVQRLGGILSRQDMAAYQPRVTDPYAICYRNAQVFGAILPNGSISTLQALKLLECLHLPGDDSPFYFHQLAEALKLVWRDRLSLLADPAFTEVPIERLLSSEHAARLAAPLLADPQRVDLLNPDCEPASPHGTLHVSAADAQGNLAAMTISQGASLGSCVTVAGLGIVLGHGMCRLDPRPGRANSIAPGKRPLNNTSPIVITMPDRKIALGLPGGRVIICAMTRAAQLIVERGYSTRQAAVALRMHIESAEPVHMVKVVGEPMLAQLQALGHQTQIQQQLAGCMNGAEYLPAQKLTRAGSGISAAAAR